MKAVNPMKPHSRQRQEARKTRTARPKARPDRRARDLSLFNELGELVAEHPDLSSVLKVGMRNLARLADVPNVFVMLLDEESQQLRMRASSIEDPSVLEVAIPIAASSAATAAVHRRAPVVIGDVATDSRVAQLLAKRFGHRALIALPLIARGQVIGTVILGETRRTRRFTKDEVDRAVAVGNQLATAIANARLYEEERRRVEDLGLLLELGRAVTASLDLEEILVLSARSVARMLDASHAFVWLLDPERHELRGAATSAEEHRAPFLAARLSLNETSLAVRAILERTAIRAADAHRSKDVNQALRDRFGMKSLVAVPLLVREEAVGAVMIGDDSRVRSWTEAELERATLVARQVAVAVANARLFEDLKRSYDELRRTQEELVKRERLAALGELSAVMAHEVRNPLGVIFNSLTSLRRVVSPEGEGQMLLDIVGEEADRLNRIVSDLLDFARPVEVSLQPGSLQAVIASAVDAARPTANASGVTVEVLVHGSLPEVSLDARMVRQALLNLLLNAVQAMPRGGTIEVRATRCETETKPCIQLDVTDTGSGVAPGCTARLFQPFFTTKASGTGLGLAVVKRIVDAHRGEISFRSDPGQGTTFTVRLPAAES